MNTNKKKLLAILMVTLLVISFVAGNVYAAASSKADDFKDVPKTAWYYDYVMCLANRGVVKGYGDTGEFRPRNKVIREHAAKMVTLAAKLSYEGKKADFPDVNKDGEMSPYIAALEDKKAIEGFPDGSFRPLDKIKRGHAAKIVKIAFDLKESYKKVKIMDLPTDDVNVATAIKVLASNGIVKGYGDSDFFRPDDEITRAEFAKMLCITITVAAVQEAEALRTPDAISQAQALVERMSEVQDTDTKDHLQERLNALKEPTVPDPDPDPDPEPLISLEADDEIPFGHEDTGFTMTFKATSEHDLKKLVIANDLNNEVILPTLTVLPIEEEVDLANNKFGIWGTETMAEWAQENGIVGSYAESEFSWILRFVEATSKPVITKMRDALWDQIKDRVVFRSFVEDVEGNQSGSLEKDTCEKTEVIFEVCAVHSYTDGGVTITVAPGRLGGFYYSWKKIPFGGEVEQSDSKIEIRSCDGDLFLAPAATGYLEFSITGRPERKLDIKIGPSQAGKQIVNLNEYWEIPGELEDFIAYEPVAYTLITKVAKDSGNGETLTLHAIWNESEKKLEWKERASNTDFPLTAVTLNSVLTGLEFSFKEGDDLKNLVVFDKNNDGSDIYYSKDGKFTIQWKWPFEGPGGGRDLVPGSWGPKATAGNKMGVMNYDDADTYITNYKSNAYIYFDFCIEIE